MLEIIAWIGCAFLVLKGAEIFLSSLREDVSDVARGASLVTMVIALILAGVFAYQIYSNPEPTSAVIEAYKGTQDAVTKAFENTSRALQENTAPADPAPAATDEVIKGMSEAGAAMDEASGE